MLYLNGRVTRCIEMIYTSEEVPKITKRFYKKGWCVYVLIVDNKVVYVGSTNQYMKRVRYHKAHNRKVGNYIKNLDSNISYKFEIVCACKDREDARKWERMIIAMYIAINVPLLNIQSRSRYKEKLLDWYFNQYPLPNFQTLQ